MNSRYTDKPRQADASLDVPSLSLQRGLRILKCFTVEQPVRGIADIADELQLARSTTHRYITTFERLGFIERSGLRKYRLGLKGTDLGRAMLDSLPLCVEARPYLQKLRWTHSYTVTIAVLDGDFVRVLDRLPGFRGYTGLGERFGPGSRLPVCCTGLGKVLIAHLPVAKLKLAIKSLACCDMKHKSITQGADFKRELSQIREVGFAVENEERAPGVIALAMPVLLGREVIAAVDISAPVSQVNCKELVEQCRHDLRATAERIATQCPTPDDI